LRPLSDPGDVQEIAARFLGQHLGANRVSYAEFQGGQYTIRREYTSGVPSRVVEGREFTAAGELRAALQRGETVVVSDAQTDPRVTDDNRATLQSRHVAAFVWTTLHKNGRMVAALGVSQVTPRVWTASEAGLVRDVAERTWDAGERTRAEASLHYQQHKLRLALEASAGASWTWAAATNQLEWDDRFRPLYGFAPDEAAAPEKWLSRVHEEDRPRLLALRDEMWTSRTKESFESTYRIVRPDGTVAWIQSRGRVDRDADGNATRLTGLDLDFTQHHRTEEALQERTAELEYRTTQLSRMASDLTLAEQRAREQIAKTLHDGLQQLLVIAALNLEQQLQRDSERDAAPSNLLSEARHQLEHAIVAARSLNVELFPPVLQHAGLPAALRWLANWTHDKYKLDVHVVTDPRADARRKDVRTLLFESVRELLFNAVKHAHVDSVTLELTLDADDQLCITVSDQGIGSNRMGSITDRRPARWAGGCSASASGSRCSAAASRSTARRARGHACGSWRRAATRNPPSAARRPRPPRRSARHRDATTAVGPLTRSGFSSSTITRRCAARSATR